jgi:hypothetical protein
MVALPAPPRLPGREAWSPISLPHLRANSCSAPGTAAWRHRRRGWSFPIRFEGFDGRHPTALRRSRLEWLHERIAHGAAVPLRAQAMLEMTEFLAPARAAAINAMSPSAVLGAARRLRAARCSDAGRRVVLRKLD